MTDAERIASEAMELPDDERVEVALKLLDSLGAPDPHADLSDAELLKMLERRVAEVQQGKVATLSWDEVRERLRANLST